MKFLIIALFSVTFISHAEAAFVSMYTDSKGWNVEDTYTLNENGSCQHDVLKTKGFATQKLSITALKSNCQGYLVAKKVKALLKSDLQLNQCEAQAKTIQQSNNSTKELIFSDSCLCSEKTSGLDKNKNDAASVSFAPMKKCLPLMSEQVRMLVKNKLAKDLN